MPSEVPKVPLRSQTDIIRPAADQPTRVVPAQAHAPRWAAKHPTRGCSGSFCKPETPPLGPPSPLTVAGSLKTPAVRGSALLPSLHPPEGKALCGQLKKVPRPRGNRIWAISQDDPIKRDLQGDHPGAAPQTGVGGFSTRNAAESTGKDLNNKALVGRPCFYDVDCLFNPNPANQEDHGGDEGGGHTRSQEEAELAKASVLSIDPEPSWGSKVKLRL